MNRVRRNYKKGSTLIEVLIALLILSFIVVPFLASFTLSAKNNHETGQMLSASYVANNQMERIIAEAKNTNLSEDGVEALFSGYTVVSGLYFIDGYYIEVNVEAGSLQNDFRRIKIDIYEDPSKSILKASIENLVQLAP